MKYSIENFNKRKIGDELTIYDVVALPDAQLDFVIAELDGNHPFIINHVSDRIYYILEGLGEVYSDSKWEPVASGDCVYIKKGDTHSIKGKLKYAIITSPPFMPQNETIESNI